MKNPKTPSEYIKLIRMNLQNLLDELQEEDHPEAETVKQLIVLCREVEALMS